MDMIDTTTDIGKSVLSVSKRFDNIRIGGYIQPQFQAVQKKGAKTFSGGDFATNVNNRFMLRRGRIRFDYIHFNQKNKPSIQFVFQFDGTERGVFIRDFWGRIFENNYKLFSFTTGMFARPFSYELNLSSSDRETPERGRMSQILMKTERDLGAMISFEPREKDHPLKYLKLDAGFFNGQGLTAPGDYDSHKDFISRIALKPLPVAKNIHLSLAASYLNGGLLQSTKYVYQINDSPDGKVFNADSSLDNIGKIAPRKYYGGDVQLKIINKACVTELRAEFITGKQSSFANTTETPASIPTDVSGALYVRKFNGAYFYLLHNIFSKKHQLVLKYDWYDPNTNVNGPDIGKAGNNINEANIKFSTLGFGYINYFNDNIKLVLWFDKVTNEKTGLSTHSGDIKDDVLTCRVQFRF
ncbi:MAG: porin [Chitinophagaceae bacterium]|nr:porin [Chitinophagaceae bacterium]